MNTIYRLAALTMGLLAVSCTEFPDEFSHQLECHDTDYEVVSFDAESYRIHLTTTIDTRQVVGPIITSYTLSEDPLTIEWRQEEGLTRLDAEVDLSYDSRHTITVIARTDISDCLCQVEACTVYQDRGMRVLPQTGEVMLNDYPAVRLNATFLNANYLDLCETGMEVSESEDFANTLQIECAHSENDTTHLFLLTSQHGLKMDTHYFYRAYCRDKENGYTRYGEVQSFTTGNLVTDMGLNVEWASKNVQADYLYSPGTHYGYEAQCLNTVYTYQQDTQACWDEAWRLPTAAEALELMNHCALDFYELEGVTVARLTASNGNRLLIPSCGIRFSQEAPLQQTDHMMLTLDNGYYLDITTDGYQITKSMKDYYLPVRLVK